MTTNTVYPVDASQRRAARVVGLLYLLLMAAGLFAQIYVPGTLPGDAHTPVDPTAAAREMTHSAGLYRVGAAVDLLTTVGDAVVAAAYCVLLRPVGRGLVALGAFWRLAQVAILGAYTLANIVALQLIGGADEVRALDPDLAAALAWVILSSHTIGYSFGLVFLGLGSTVFSYLLYRSRYVPRPLAVLGIVGSTLLAGGSLVLIVVPEATGVVDPALYVPMFFFEVVTGLWLLIRGVPLTPEPA
jgi:hypothetical protein